MKCGLSHDKESEAWVFAVNDHVDLLLFGCCAHIKYFDTYFWRNQRLLCSLQIVFKRLFSVLRQTTKKQKFCGI